MKININLGNGYDIIIGENHLEQLSKYLTFALRVLIVTDSNIPQEYQNLITKQINNKVTEIYKVEAGENSKSIDVYQSIIKKMIDLEFTRQDMVIALGGGVVGDLAGFVASTFKRGCRFVNIPTSTLAMVDSSVGGKVALNFAGIKNVVGSFYQPELVFIDLATLKTLPKRQYYNGLVEALKVGLICDEQLVDLFTEIEQNLLEIIHRSLLAKKRIVKEDEKELNKRKLLNFGHTIGHGIESLYYPKIYHGEAVAIGMILMIENSTLKNKVINILKNMNISFFCEDYQAIYHVILQDKKRNDNSISVVKVYHCGQGVIEDINLTEIKNILKGATNGINNW